MALKSCDSVACMEAESRASGEQGISGFMTYPFCVFSVLLFGREAPTDCYVASSYTLARLETKRF
jgi:hypothetical protein